MFHINNEKGCPFIRINFTNCDIDKMIRKKIQTKTVFQKSAIISDLTLNFFFKTMLRNAYLLKDSKQNRS